MQTTDISIVNLIAGLLLMAVPIYFFKKYYTGMVKSTIMAVVRMVAQLFFVGLYLKYLFLWDNPLLNIAWVVIMVFVATETSLTRIKLKRSVMMLPLLIGFITASLLVGLYFLGIVLQLDNIFSAQYFIPIMGILMGNMLGVNVIGLNTFYYNLMREKGCYYYLLGNGATIDEATAPFVRQAITRAFSPAIANMAVGTCGTARHNDWTDFRWKQPGYCNKIPDDDYCNNNCCINSIAYGNTKLVEAFYF